MPQLSGFVSPLIDLLLPVRCVGCGWPSAPLCAACRPRGRALRVPHAGLTVAAAGSYDGALRTALVAYKERGRRDLAAPLAAALADAIIGLDAGPRIVLVGVPSSRAAARSRGGDHVARLVRLAARRCGVATAAPLRQIRPVRDSAGLGAAARRVNIARSMLAGPPSSPHAVVLADDIVTTGSTLGEAGRALRAAGWAVAGAAVVAATPLGGHGQSASTASALAGPG